MEARTHFVYRVFDADGVLLFVTATKCPSANWHEQRTFSAAWRHRIARFRVSGPHTKRRALDMRWAAIQTENPLFNNQTPANQARPYELGFAYLQGRRVA